MDSWIPKVRDHWTYGLLGPTTVHLQHEFYLLVALLFLAISRFQSLYGDTVCSWGDCKYLFITTLWLSRHLIVRWLTTLDTSTSRSPTISGLLVFWLTSHFMAGQYFDRPNPQVVAKQLGTSNMDDGRIVAAISSFFSPSILYAWQLLRVRIWFPILTLQERSWNMFSGRKSFSFQKGKSGHKSLPQKTSLVISQAYSYWDDFWSVYGISLQAILPSGITILYIWYGITNWGYSDMVYAYIVNTSNSDEEALDRRPYGAYKKLQPPTLTQLLVLLTAGGMLTTILLYNQILLPFPDLVAGSNVLKAVRNEAKVNVSQTGVSLFVFFGGGGALSSLSPRMNRDILNNDVFSSLVTEI